MFNYYPINPALCYLNTLILNTGNANCNTYFNLRVGDSSASQKLSSHCVADTYLIITLMLCSTCTHAHTHTHTQTHARTHTLCLKGCDYKFVAVLGTMEGPLSKWTNVMQGWQYRWFVLDGNIALLSYYTVCYFIFVYFLYIFKRFAAIIILW